jgi:hypothetical protein
MEKTDLMLEFEKKTDKKAVWHGKITKGFKKWRKKKLKKEKEKTMVICPWCSKKVSNYLTHICPQRGF